MTNPTRPVDTTRARFVLAVPGDGPLEQRAISWRASNDEFAASELDGRELIEVVGDAATLFPLDGEGPRHWELLHPTDGFVCDVTDGIEAYRTTDRWLRPGLIMIVATALDGAPIPLGTIPVDLGPRPAGSSDAAAEAELEWLERLETSDLFERLERGIIGAALPAVHAWSFVEHLRDHGFNPAGDRISEWIAARVFAAR